ncbi:MAG: hypothetical protein JO056_00815 [Alphaproteobacteria bacterium]|nr:hypothetical protein [Alphaproteobacteria bacterium]
MTIHEKTASSIADLLPPQIATAKKVFRKATPAMKKRTHEWIKNYNPHPDCFEISQRGELEKLGPMDFPEQYYTRLVVENRASKKRPFAEDGNDAVDTKHDGLAWQSYREELRRRVELVLLSIGKPLIGFSGAMADLPPFSIVCPSVGIFADKPRHRPAVMHNRFIIECLLRELRPERRQASQARLVREAYEKADRDQIGQKMLREELLRRVVQSREDANRKVTEVRALFDTTLEKQRISNRSLAKLIGSDPETVKWILEHYDDWCGPRALLGEHYKDSLAQVHSTEIEAAINEVCAGYAMLHLRLFKISRHTSAENKELEEKPLVHAAIRRMKANGQENPTHKERRTFENEVRRVFDFSRECFRALPEYLKARAEEITDLSGSLTEKRLNSTRLPKNNKMSSRHLSFYSESGSQQQPKSIATFNDGTELKFNSSGDALLLVPSPPEPELDDKSRQRQEAESRKCQMYYAECAEQERQRQIRALEEIRLRKSGCPVAA